MTIAVVLLLTAGIIKILDLAVFHGFAHNLRNHSDARGELFVHALTGFLYGVLLVSISNFSFSGLWMWGLSGILGLTLLLHLAGFAVERGSRRTLGGVPSLERVLHASMTVCVGAVFPLFLLHTMEGGGLESGFAYTPDKFSIFLRISAAVMAVFLIYFAVEDFTAIWQFQKEKVQSQDTKERSHSRINS